MTATPEQVSDAQPQRGPVQAVSCHDGLSAQLAWACGFRALYVSSYVQSATRGVRDNSYLGLEERVQVTRDIHETVTEAELVVDADAGFGGPMQAAYACGRLFQAGATTIHIEDQQHPKREAAVQPALVDVDAMCEKIAAVAAVRDRLGGPQLIARTDALRPEGYSQAVERVRAYLEAGADMFMVHGLESLEQLASCVADVDTKIAVTVGHWSDRLWSIDDLANAGASLVLYTSPPIRALAGAIFECYSAIAEDRLHSLNAICIEPTDFERYLGNPHG